MSSTYSGSPAVTEARTMLGSALAALQEDPKAPAEVDQVTQCIAEAVRALFSAQQASVEGDGERYVRTALGSLSQTLILLQEVRTHHAGIALATETIAKAVSQLYRLIHRAQGGKLAEAEPGAQSQPEARPQRKSVPKIEHDVLVRREKIETQLGAATESNFYVGFSGEISEGGVFVATYNVVDIGTPIELSLTLPGGFNLQIPGTVRFVRDPMDLNAGADPGMGVEFDTLAPPQRELILRFIWKRAPLFYDE